MAGNKNVNSSHEHADKLMKSLLDGVEDNDALIADRLLEKFFRGYPLNKLCLLLKSNNHEIVAAGVWIASELGSDARPLFNDIIALMNHPFHRVRFFVLDCLISCGQPEDKLIINKAIDLLEDPHAGVRWKSLVLLATLPDDVILAAMDMAVEQNSTSHANGRALLLKSLSTHEDAAITTNLASNDVVLRKYAAAAAARIAPRNPSPLRQAMKSQDADIRDFAKFMWTWIQL